MLLHQLMRFAEALGVDLNALVPRMSELADSEIPEAASSRIDYLQRLRDLAESGSEELNPEWKR